MKKFEVSGHEPSYLPEGEWELVWSDEFDGTELDESKWNYRLDFWGKRSPTFSKDASSARFKGRCIPLSTSANGFFDIRYPQRYGRFLAVR